MQTFVASGMRLPHATHGFTVVELMVVIAILAILTVIGAPPLSEFVADQRVRAATSDLYGDMAFARVKAIEASRRAYVTPVGGNWKNGWRVYVDLDNSGTEQANETLKVFDGIKGRPRVCPTVSEFATSVIFRPVGRVVRTSTVTGTDGIYVIDDLSDSVQSNNKVRAVMIGVSGRATVVKMNGVVPPCNN